MFDIRRKWSMDNEQVLVHKGAGVHAEAGDKAPGRHTPERVPGAGSHTKLRGGGAAAGRMTHVVATHF